MGFGFTEEEVMFENIASSFLSGKNGVSKFRTLRDSQKTFDEDIWNSIKDMGWPGLVIEEQYGGTEMSVISGCILAATIGQNLSLIPLVSSAILASRVISSTGTDAQKQQWLPRLSSGLDITALAFEGGSVASLQTQGDDLVLSGQIDHVIDGMTANKIIVLTKHPDGQSALCSITLEQDGIKRTPLISVDGRDVARITITNVPVEKFNILGEASLNLDALEYTLAYGALIYAAEQIGCARAAFDLTLSYLKERQQFGKIIGSFQALQHRAALLYTELSLAEALIIKTAGLLENKAPSCIRFCSLAKAKAGQAARLITNEAIQLHGGIGVTDEYDVGLYLKRVAVSERLYGDYNFHADKAAQLAGY